MTKLRQALPVIYLPDTRGVQISPYGKGNTKLGDGVYTYSRNPGLDLDDIGAGTCPGATKWCLKKCYAFRVVMEHGVVAEVWDSNSWGDNVPQIPDDCKLLRLHVGGDFDSVNYIENWRSRLLERPDVTCWAYTRSWRCPELLPALERLWELPNMQLFASMDPSTTEEPPAGWRVAWIDGDDRLLPHSYAPGAPHSRNRLSVREWVNIHQSAYVCPEETGHKKDCASCRYCFDGKRNDVVFLEH